MDTTCWGTSLRSPPIAWPSTGVNAEIKPRALSTHDLLRRVGLMRQRGEQRQRCQVRPALPALAARLGGREIAPGLVEVVRRYPLSYRHGRVRPGLLAALTGDAGGICHWPGSLDPNRVQILDTVATALVSGAVSMPVLIGETRPETGALVMRQWLLAERAAESDLRDRLATHLGRDQTLVTFNGKDFDVPLLINRCHQLGRHDPFADQPHLDLPHVLRRTHGRHLPDCRLKTAETHLLGLQGHQEQPTAFAPGTWREWLRAAQVDRLGQALAHNRDNMLSSAALLLVLAGIVACPATVTGQDRVQAQDHQVRSSA